MDEGITLGFEGHLRPVCKETVREHMETKFRPSHFPFTEPSAEIDATCFVCSGPAAGCARIPAGLSCRGRDGTPGSTRKVRYRYDQVFRFAFGMGLDRLTMLKYGIDDLRLLFENDIRFLKQF